MGSRKYPWLYRSWWRTHDIVNARPSSSRPFRTRSRKLYTPIRVNKGLYASRLSGIVLKDLPAQVLCLCDSFGNHQRDSRKEDDQTQSQPVSFRTATPSSYRHARRHGFRLPSVVAHDVHLPWQVYRLYGTAARPGKEQTLGVLFWSGITRGYHTPIPILSPPPRSPRRFAGRRGPALFAIERPAMRRAVRAASLLLPMPLGRVIPVRPFKRSPTSAAATTRKSAAAATPGRPAANSTDPWSRAW